MGQHRRIVKRALQCFRIGCTATHIHWPILALRLMVVIAEIARPPLAVNAVTARLQPTCKCIYFHLSVRPSYHLSLPEKEKKITARARDTLDSLGSSTCPVPSTLIYEGEESDGAAAARWRYDEEIRGERRRCIPKRS